MALDMQNVLDLIQKGVGVIETVVKAGKDAAPAIGIVKNFISGAKQGDMTDAEIMAFEEQLDAMIDDFNVPME